MFVTQNQIAEIADDMQSHFEFGLSSQSSINLIASIAQEELADRGLPTRRSLAIVIAKLALALWHETILQTKREIASQPANVAAIREKEIK